MILAGAALVLLSALPVQALSGTTGSHVFAKMPAPGTRIRTFFPIVSAEIRDASGVRLFVDGNDVTASAAIRSHTLRYVPNHRMNAGWHDVFLEGTGIDRRRFSDAWVFETQSPDSDSISWDDDGGFQFIPVGTFIPGSFMHFFLVAPDDGFAVLRLCGLGSFPFEHPFGSPVFFVTLVLPLTPATAFLNCNVNALFTPLGFAEPVFIPLEIAGPPRPLPQHSTSAARTVMPVGRMQDPFAQPVMRATIPVMRTTAPVMRTTMPVMRPVTPVMRTTTPVMRSTVPAMPHVPSAHVTKPQ